MINEWKNDVLQLKFGKIYWTHFNNVICLFLFSATERNRVADQIRMKYGILKEKDNGTDYTRMG